MPMPIIVILVLIYMIFGGSAHGAMLGENPVSAGTDLKFFPKWVEASRGATAKPVTPNTGDVIEKVNSYVNQVITYKGERADHWQKPLETLKLGTGDCEDFAILKYFILKAQGIRVDKMQIVVLFDIQTLQYHEVLWVDGRILDNQHDRVMPERDLETRYLPFYSVNEKGWTMYRY